MTEQRGEIKAMDLDGSNIIPIPKGVYETIRQIHGVVGDMIYYRVITDDLESGADELARMSVDGTFREIVSRKIN